MVVDVPRGIPDKGRGSTYNEVKVMSSHTLASSLVTCYPAIRHYIVYILTASLTKHTNKQPMDITLKDV